MPIMKCRIWYLVLLLRFLSSADQQSRNSSTHSGGSFLKSTSANEETILALLKLFILSKLCFTDQT